MQLIKKNVAHFQSQNVNSTHTVVAQAPNAEYSLKGQCHEIFDHFFALKIRPGPHIIRRKRFRELFCFHEDIRLQISKIACPSSQRLGQP